MKAIIPVAGIGTRLRPHTHTQPKALIQVAGKPILAHILDSLVEAGIQDFVFIIGYLGEKIQDYVTENYPQIHSIFVTQQAREGIAHALWMAKEFIRNEDKILIALGDTLFDMNMKDFLKTPHTALGVKKVKDPRRFGVVELGKNEYICRLIEKPTEPVSNLALVGIYKIQEVKELFDSIEYNITHNIRTKDEFQLTDALMIMIDKGTEMIAYPIENWFDCGKKEALLETNAILLSRPKYVNDNHSFKNTIIIPPVNIADSCEISYSIIGPNVSIGAKAHISNSIIRESIIGPEAEIKNALLQNSLIGNESVLKGLMQSLNLGDSTEINYE